MIIQRRYRWLIDIYPTSKAPKTRHVCSKTKYVICGNGRNFKTHVILYSYIYIHISIFILFNWPVNKNYKFWEVNYLSLGGFSVFGALVFIPRRTSLLQQLNHEVTGHVGPKGLVMRGPARWRPFWFAMGKWQVKRFSFLKINTSWYRIM